jgi:hypothetical protein
MKPVEKKGGGFLSETEGNPPPDGINLSAVTTNTPPQRHT